LVENIIAIILSIVLIIFDARFIRNPYVCYWPTSACTTFLLDLGLGIIYSLLGPDAMRMKMNAIKAQLACAVIMLIVSVAFVCIYTYTTITVRGKTAAISQQPTMEMNRPPPAVWSVPAPAPTPAPMWYPQGSQIPPPIPHASVGGFVRN
jgi:type IV secretory pathway TrbL component